MSRYRCEWAWLGDDAPAAGVELTVADGIITAVDTAPAGPSADTTVLPGLTLPGLANAHSHAFHRALRGRSERGGGTFWTWRDQMYAVAERLDPDRYYELARATYAEMALAGVTCVGEFHYVHHQRGGRPYQDPNAMGAALIAAAADAGIRVTLLDACYLEGGPGRPLEGPQLRFGDADAAAWAERTEQAAGSATSHTRFGAAIHSVRAVPPKAAALVAAWAQSHRAPLHFHLSEQPAENEASLAAYGATPAQVLGDAGALGPHASAVHATHLEPPDIERLGATRTRVCLCPTTERDLGDGIGPARALAQAGCPLTVGTDSNAMIDLWEEARAVELDERLARRQRSHWRATDLLTAATAEGHASLGWPEAGYLRPGAPADWVTVGLDSPRLAGADRDCLLETVLFAATAADVADVVVAGTPVVRGGQHLRVPDVAAALTRSIAAVTR
jgi:formiminoglutamate deiminase